ncbi:MAG: phage protein GemA/Gp16 family protein [Candidatus Aenigmatarchaeota archaeon]
MKKSKKETSLIKKTEKINELEKYIREEETKRRLLSNYIERNLKEGVDYGKITIKTKEGKEYSSKPTLFKSGAEKICSLLKLTPFFIKDDVIRIPDLPEHIVLNLVCELRNKDGKVISTGRGGGILDLKNVKNFDFEYNKLIKIVEKRAQVDAVLRLGLSEFFTQDIEEEELDEPQNTTQYNIKSSPQPLPTPAQSTKPQQNQQFNYKDYLIKKLHILLTNLQKLNKEKYSDEKYRDFLKVQYGVTSSKELNTDQLKELIKVFSEWYNKEAIEAHNKSS